MGIDERLLAEAKAKDMLRYSHMAAADGRGLIEKSISLRKQALDLLPPGVILEFVFPYPVDSEYHVIRQDDLRWTHDGKTVDADWVEEKWMRNNLRIHGSA